MKKIRKIGTALAILGLSLGVCFAYATNHALRSKRDNYHYGITGITPDGHYYTVQIFDPILKICDSEDDICSFYDDNGNLTQIPVDDSGEFFFYGKYVNR